MMSEDCQITVAPRNGRSSRYVSIRFPTKRRSVVIHAIPKIVRPSRVTTGCSQSTTSRVCRIPSPAPARSIRLGLCSACAIRTKSGSAADSICLKRWGSGITSIARHSFAGRRSRGLRRPGDHTSIGIAWYCPRSVLLRSFRLVPILFRLSHCWHH